MIEIKKTNTKEKGFYTKLGKLFTDKTVIKELGEPIITSEEQTWFIAYYKNKIAAFSSNYIKKDLLFLGYIYVLENYRECGIAQSIINKHIEFAKENNIKIIETVATNEFKKILLKNNFEVTKEYVNYTKMRLKI